MAFCLTLDQKSKFKNALKDRTIDPEKLATMTSLERRVFLEKYVGKENSKQTNALFESKILLKNQQRGYITWAKKLSGITPQTRMDLLSRIEKMDHILDPKEEQSFLQDLASTRLRIDITQEEAKTISDLSKKQESLKQKADDNGVFRSETERLEYGSAKVEIENYINDLKLQSRRISFREQPLRAIGKTIGEAPGALKSIVASLDNSFWGRQGIKTLADIRTSKIWARNFIKSWGDIGKQLSGKDAMGAIKADIYSRPNALNGKYKAGDYGLTVLSEEAYPSSLPDKIPVFSRLFKASEVAYNGGALRLRADLADRLIAKAEQHGVNTLNKEEAQGLGHLVKSITGRGSLGKGEAIAKELNVLLFSVKFLKSNIDTLTAHRFDPKVTGFAQKEASKNLLSILVTFASVLTLAELLNPDSVDKDPQSTNFGKIKIFGIWTDITGGMAGLVTLASRLIPTRHNGEWGMWNKSSTGRWTNLTAGDYGQQDGWDLLLNSLVSNKLSPFAGILRDIWKGETFGGDPVTLKSEALNQLPISVQNYGDLKNNPNADFMLGSMILEGLGLSIGTYYYKANWNENTSKEMLQFKSKIGQAKFNEANDVFNKKYSDWFKKMNNNKEYNSLSSDSKADLVTKAKKEIKQQVFKQYRFKYKTTKPTSADKREDKKIDKLLP